MNTHQNKTNETQMLNSLHINNISIDMLKKLYCITILEQHRAPLQKNAFPMSAEIFYQDKVTFRRNKDETKEKDLNNSH